MFGKVYLVITWLPVLIQLMKQLEEAIPGQGTGEQKLAAVRGLLESLYGLSGKTDVPFAEIWPSIASAASTLATAFNATGTFSRGNR